MPAGNATVFLLAAFTPFCKISVSLHSLLPLLLNNTKFAFWFLLLFIFNDTELDKESLRIYGQFREKVVDVELDYNPTPEECASIIFKENTDVSSVDSKLYKNSVKL